jgi:predicted permease
MSLLDDIRLALRTLRRRPGLAAVTTATLALGVGVNSAMFSLVDGVLLRPLPYPAPERLVSLAGTSPTTRDDPHSPGDYLALKAAARAFEHLAAYRRVTYELLPDGGGEPQRVTAAEVTPAFFDVFGLAAARGRALREDADRPGDRRALLSDGAWRSLFGGGPGIVGRALRLDGVPVTVVGVMPAEFRWPPEAQVWRLADLPVPSSPLGPRADLLSNHGLRYFDVVGRLRADVSTRAAEAELDALAARLAEAHPDNNHGRGLRLVGLRDDLVGGVRRSLLLLAGVVALVLLIAVGNVANLLLAQGVARARELAVRSSLGASPARLLRQLLVESALLGSLGGAAGLLAAWLSLPLLLRLLPADLPRAEDVTVDPRVVLVTLALALAAGLLSGLAPALQGWRTDLVAPLRASGRASGGAGQGLRRVLVAAELALALAVLASAGLLLRSLVNLDRVDPGFRREGVTLVDLDLPASRYPSRQAQARFYDAVLERLSASGRVRAAAGFPTPFGDGTSSDAPVQREARTPPGDPPRARLGVVSPGWFGALGVPLVSGRDFTAADGAQSPRVVIISESLARRDWPGEDPLGSRVRLGDEDLFSVVGVARDVQRRGPDVAPEPTIYLLHRQFSLPMLHLVVSGGDLASAVSEARAAVRAVDPALPLGATRALDELRARALSEPRFRGGLLASFALLAVALAALGLFGVMSDTVQRRRQEMGVRLALGAHPAALVTLVLADGLRLALYGCAGGLALALAGGRVLASLLFGVAARDPLTLAGVAALLVGVALVSAWLPARRAALVDPLTALRAE